jgi:hypothetical protein
VSGGERRRLVEEEQLREAAGLHQWLAMPAPEPEAASDPAPGGVVSADPTGSVVEAAPVAVHEPSRGVGDQLAERRDPVPERHGHTL